MNEYNTSVLRNESEVFSLFWKCEERAVFVSTLLFMEMKTYEVQNVLLSLSIVMISWIDECIIETLFISFFR